MDFSGDLEFVGLALEQARLAYKEDEVPIGCVITKEGEVIASAYNLVETNKSSTHHAEILAIKKASEVIGDWRLTDCSIFVTLEPCPMCAGAIRLARLERVAFGAYDKRNGAFGSKYDLSKGTELGPKLEVIGGVLEAECREILQKFFKEKRGEKK